MMNKNITLLSFINLSLRIFIQGMFIVYPIIIQNTNASKTAIGYFLSAMFIASLCGNWLSGKLTPGIVKPKLLLLLSVMPISVFIALFGQCVNYYSLLICALGISFFSGININTNIILTGLFSSNNTVAKNFGLMGISNIVSTLLGSLIIGFFLGLYGNKIAFIIFSVFYLFSNILFIWVDNPVVVKKEVIKAKLRFGKNIIFLLTCSLLIIMLIHLFKMSLSLELKKEGYSIKQISYLSAMGSFIVLPVPYLLGYLTKYFSSKTLLMFCYTVTVLAFAILLFAGNKYVVIISIAFISILAYGSFIPVMDILFQWYDKDLLGKAQTYYGNIAWIAAIVGYSFTGQLLQNFGYTLTILTGMCTGITAILMLQFGVSTNSAVISEHI